MTARVFLRALSATILLAACCCAAPAWSAPVLMISIDGLKPEYVTHADEHGLRIPTLRRFLAEGTYADGVTPVLPSVTYPDHTTLITGVWPAEHGILNNDLFDPNHTLGGAWYWYANSIKVPTLWDAAHAAGLRTASVSWPVSVNAESVDWLLPEYWRGSTSGEEPNPQDVHLMEAISRPVGGLAEMEQRLGAYMPGNNTTVELGDEVRTRFALDILARQKPAFMTIHLSALDHSEHISGVYSAEANQTLEAVDAMVARLMAAALKNDPSTKIVIVSDHGFVNITHVVSLSVPFVAQGLATTGKERGGKVRFWSSGGLTAVYLRDPADAATREQARVILTSLASDAVNGIAEILDEKQTAEHGGFTGAAFLIVMKPGYIAGYGTSGPMVTEATAVHGAHGFWPLLPEMRSSFFAMGAGIARGRDLGQIDMRQIAPTVAGLLGVPLPTAKQTPLHVAE